MLAVPLYFRTLWRYTNCIIIIYYYVLPLLHVSEQLHAHLTIKTHTDVENRDLVNSFSPFFVSKITDICARGGEGHLMWELKDGCGRVKAPMNNQTSTN